MWNVRPFAEKSVKKQNQLLIPALILCVCVCARVRARGHTSVANQFEAYSSWKKYHKPSTMNPKCKDLKQA